MSFTIGKPPGSNPAMTRSMNVLDLVAAVLPIAACERIVLLREFYDERAAQVDQTLHGCAECAIEIVLRKRDIPTLRALMDQTLSADRAETGLAASQRATELYPYHFEAWHFAAMQTLRWGVPHEQDAMWVRARTYLPDEHGPWLYQVLHEISSGRLHKGFGLREARFRNVPWQRRTKVQPPDDIPAWTGQPLTGKSVVIWSEFGLGDEIFFFRFARILREQCGAAQVCVVCQTPLKELFTASREASVVVDIGHMADLPPCDYWVYPHAIPACLPLELDALPQTVPYLRAPPREGLPDDAPAATLKVGIAFKGDPTHENDRARSLPSLSTLDNLFALPGIEFFSLQKGQGVEETARYAQERANFHDLGPALQTMAQTASAIAELDLLLAVDTSVAHVAAAMGKTVWLMLPLLCDWRWHYLREDSPWYPTVRIFRHEWGDVRDWSAVVAQIQTALHALHEQRVRKPDQS